MSTLVLCLVVVGAAFVVVNRQIEGPQTATHTTPPDRDPAEESSEMPVDAPAEPRRPRHLARGSELEPEPDDLPEAWSDDTETAALDGRERPARAGALLGLLLVALGAGAALVIGLVLVAVVTALRTAIG